MGRYYSGDIEGKFWFAIQSSTAADRFGVEYTEPNHVEYYFDEDHLEVVQKELANIEASENFTKTKNFFCKGDRWNKDSLVKEGITEDHLRNYADYCLGKKIEQSILEHGQCFFTAEL